MRNKEVRFPDSCLDRCLAARCLLRFGYDVSSRTYETITERGDIRRELSKYLEGEDDAVQMCAIDADSALQKPSPGTPSRLLGLCSVIGEPNELTESSLKCIRILLLRSAVIFDLDELQRATDLSKSRIHIGSRYWDGMTDQYIYESKYTDPNYYMLLVHIAELATTEITRRTN